MLMRLAIQINECNESTCKHTEKAQHKFCVYEFFFFVQEVSFDKVNETLTLKLVENIVPSLCSFANQGILGSSILSREKQLSQSFPIST